MISLGWNADIDLPTQRRDVAGLNPVLFARLRHRCRKRFDSSPAELSQMCSLAVRFHEVAQDVLSQADGGGWCDRDKAQTNHAGTKHVDLLAFAAFQEIDFAERIHWAMRGRSLRPGGDRAVGRLRAKRYPSLVDDAWLWGGAPESIAETLRVGVNAPDPDTRVSEMPAFGHDQILDREAILQVAAYVRSLADPVSAAASHSQAVAAGKEIFAANCAACHGDNGQGNSDAGAPNLSDSFWLYGGDPQTVFRTIFYGRKGHMPAWEHRLTELERKILALYIRDLRSWPEGARR